MLLRQYERTESRMLLEKAQTHEGVDLAKLNFNESVVPFRKTEKEFRILSFGDSFAYSIVQFPFSYHGVASNLLTKSHKLSVRIVNLGEPNISFYQYIRSYLYWGKLIEHDAVIFNVYLGNDLLDIAYGYVPNKRGTSELLNQHNLHLQTGIPREIPVSIRIHTHYPLRLLDYTRALFETETAKSKKTHAPIDLASPYNLALRRLPQKKYYQTNHTQLDNFAPDKLAQLLPGYQAFVELVSAASLIRRNGKSVLIILSPSETQIEPKLQQELQKQFQVDLDRLDFHLSAFLMRHASLRLDPEIPVMLLFDVFECARKQNQKLYYATDTHWSLEGNRLVGEILAQYISRSWLSDLSKAPLKNLQSCVTHRKDLLGKDIFPTKDRVRSFQSFIEPLLSIPTVTQ